MHKIANKHIYSFDTIRFIACMLVILIHLTSDLVTYASNTDFLLGNFFNSISRVGVPLFVMVSGALMLDENKNFSINKLFKKNILNIIFLIICWNILYDIAYNIITPLIKDESLSLQNIVKDIFISPTHMWYLYMTIGLYLATPFLRLLTKTENKNLVLLYIIISLIFTFSLKALDVFSIYLSDLKILYDIFIKLKLDFFSGYVTYYLSGWYIFKIGIPNATKKKIYILGILSLCFIFIYAQLTTEFKDVYNFLSIFVYFYTVAVFIYINNINGSIHKKSIIQYMSKLSLGIYLIHPLFIFIYRKLITLNIPIVIDIILQFVIVLFASLIFTYVVSKIPILNKLVKI